MTYRVIPNSERTHRVHDGPDYLGEVYDWGNGAFTATKAWPPHIPAMHAPYARGFPSLGDAAEWLVCEHRDIPWADRPECQRVTAL